MGIRFQCPHCLESLNVKDQLAGRRGKCPHCRASIRIPASQSAEADVGELPVGSPETSPTAINPSPPPPALPRSSPVALPGVPPSHAATALPPAASLGSSPPPAPGLPDRAAPTHAVTSRQSSPVDAPAAPPSGEPGGGLSAIQVRRARELQKRRQRQLLLSVALLLMALGLLSALVWVLARSAP